MDWKLVPPYTHQWNSVEREMRTFKNPLFPRLCRNNKNFPLHLWKTGMITHALITLNLLKVSIINPNSPSMIKSSAHLITIENLLRHQDPRSWSIKTNCPQNIGTPCSWQLVHKTSHKWLTMCTCMGLGNPKQKNWQYCRVVTYPSKY